MDYNSILRRIVAGEFTNIVVLTGPGISANAGLPDYRSPAVLDSILPQLLQDYPHLENITDVSELFTQKQYALICNHPLVKREYVRIEGAIPTTAHEFCLKLYKLNLLRRVYTQNFDGLHHKVGLPAEKIVPICGDTITNGTKKIIIGDFMTAGKPVDLIVAMGTDLQTLPFALLINLPKRYCPRILVDCNPRRAFSNDWTNRVYKLADKTVKLTAKWERYRWEQYIFAEDLDVWSNKCMIRWS